jgi:hypothetical protein
MSTAGLTHSQVAVMLIDGALAHIAGNVQGKMPINPEPVADLDRARVGLKLGGQTLLYRIGNDGVFMDLTGALATVWFVGADFDRALAATDALMKKFRSKQVKDEAMEVPKHRRRVYEVDLGSGRMSTVNIEYAERGAQQERFRVIVAAFARK